MSVPDPSLRLAELTANLAAVRARIAAACAAAGRSTAEVQLIAVTKTFPVPDIMLLHQLGVADIGAVHGEGRFHTALPVDGELGREVGSAVAVGHGTRGQEQELAEVALVERQFADCLAGKGFAARSGRLAGSGDLHQPPDRVLGGLGRPRRLQAELEETRAGGHRVRLRRPDGRLRQRV